MYEPITLATPELETLVDGLDFIPPASDKEYWFGRLDATGVPAFLTMMSSGHLPAVIALQNGIPLLWFEEWFELRVDKNLLRRAKHACAQVASARSAAVLKGTPINPAAAILQKSLSERLAWQAERLDPEHWGVQKTQGPSQVPITIRINLTAPKRDPSKSDQTVIDVTPTQKALT